MREDLKALQIDKQQRRRQPTGHGRGWLIVVLLTLLVGLTGYTFWPFAAVSESVPPVDSPPAVESAPEPTSPGRDVLVASGYVVAHHRISLGSKVIGRVEWMGVDKGDFVTKGQLLVKLEDREFRAQLAQAEAILEGARSRLRELETGSRPEEIDRALAALGQSEAERDNARIEFDRIQSLADDGVVSTQQLDNARSRFDVAAASVKVAQKNHDLLEIGPRREQIDQGRAEVARASANVEYQQTLLDATEIRAPVRGTVLARIAEIGEMITTSFAGAQGAKSAVVSLADLDDLQVELDISQTDFKLVSRDQECEMTPEAYPGRVYRCEIDEISPEANRQKATIQVKVKILEPDELLRPEMSARVTFRRPEQKSEEGSDE